LGLVVAAGALVLAGPAAPERLHGTAGQTCRGTVPTREAPPDAGFGREGFNYGGSKLRVAIYWPNGTLAAGPRADGGSYATVNDDGTIHAKVGWWRGLAARLVITGRRLDGTAPPLRASVPGGYGERGFVPSGLVFPTPGCWRVVGRLGPARLAFVVRARLTRFA
jgi:hypothetical protein